MATSEVVSARPSLYAHRLVATIRRNQPLFALLGCIVSFTSGYTYKLYLQHIEQVNKIAEDWTATSRMINLVGSNQLNDALSMQRFEDLREYRQQARQLEITILGRISDPEAFDSIYFRLQNKSSSQAEVTDLEELDRNLSRQIRSLLSYATFSSSELKLDPADRLQHFLLNPARYLSDQKDIFRAEALIWELDSVSGGLNCIWIQHTQGCPSRRPTGHEDPEMILVNYDFAKLFADSATSPALFKTCSVHAVWGIDDSRLRLSCDSDAK